MYWITLFKKYGRQCLMLTALFLIPVTGTAQEQPLAELLERARAAGIEQSQLENIQSRAADRNVSDEELTGLIGPAVSLAEQNLPSDMIFQKVMEGLAKGIPVQQMDQVLQNIRRSTESVVPVVDSWMGGAEVNEMLASSGERFDRDLFRNEMLKAGSKAASGQTGPALVRDILNSLTDAGAIPAAKPSSVLAGISIISDMPEVAKRPHAASAIVVRAIQNNFSAADIQKLPGAMDVAQRRSRLPADAVLEGVSQQIQGNITASQILQNLFNGNVGGGIPGNTPPGRENRPGRGGPP
ncbi:MAG: hypothetical protein WD317_10215 [Balneolaceae bacterium]